LELDAQSESKDFDLDQCSGVVRVTRTITENPLECGEYYVSASFEFIEAPCNMEIIRAKWYNGENKHDYAVVRDNQTFHLHSGGSIDLDFYVKYENSSLWQHIVWSYETPPSSGACSGCGNTFNYCDIDKKFIDWSKSYQEWDEEKQEWVWVYFYYTTMIQVWEITFITPDGLLEVNFSNSYGIFTFPYYLKFADDCGLSPDINDFVFDINRFLDLAQSGNDEYADFYGHVLLQDYNTPGMCKKYFKFEDMGIYPWRIKAQYDEYKPYYCSYTDVHLGDHYTFRDTDFPCFTECYPEISTLICDPGAGAHNMIINSPNDFTKFVDKYIEYRLYPNISNDFINIDFFNPEEKQIKIFDVQGGLVESIEIKKNQNMERINVSQYNNGVYILKIRNMETGKSWIEKIVKQ